jgi:hypothetical protein
MTCLCAHCKDNAVVSADDLLCADCAADVAAVVIPIRSRPERPCMFGRSWCDGDKNCCVECAEFTAAPRDAA